MYFENINDVVKNSVNEWNTVLNASKFSSMTVDKYGIRLNVLGYLQVTLSHDDTISDTYSSIIRFIDSIIQKEGVDRHTTELSMSFNKNGSLSIRVNSDTVCVVHENQDLESRVINIYNLLVYISKNLLLR